MCDCLHSDLYHHMALLLTHAAKLMNVGHARGIHMKVSELWITIGGTRLMSTVSVHKMAGDNLIRIEIEGYFGDDDEFVTNILLAAFNSGNHKCCVVDVHDLVFTERLGVSEIAVDCLLKLAGAAIKKDMVVFLVIDDGYVREVISTVLKSHLKRSKVSVQSNDAWMVSDLRNVMMADGK